MLYDALVFLVVAMIAGARGVNCSGPVFIFLILLGASLLMLTTKRKTTNACITKYTLRLLTIIAPPLTQQENTQ